MLAVVFIVNSCKKTEVDSDTTSSKDNAVAEQSFNHTNKTIVSIAIKEEGVNKRASDEFSCATVTVSADSLFPKTLTIDYGTGCADTDGRKRSGKITAVFSEAWQTIGATVSISFENYTVDDISISNATVMQLINNGQWSYTTRIENGMVSGSDWDVQYDCDKTIKWVEGFETDSIANDDVFEITGTSIGVNRNGETYSVVILQPLVEKASCAWITKGQISLTPKDRATRTVDFGDDSCDPSATVTINGNEYNIILD